MKKGASATAMAKQEPPRAMTPPKTTPSVEDHAISIILLFRCLCLSTVVHPHKLTNTCVHRKEKGEKEEEEYISLSFTSPCAAYTYHHDNASYKTSFSHNWISKLNLDSGHTTRPSFAEWGFLSRILFLYFGAFFGVFNQFFQLFDCRQNKKSKINWYLKMTDKKK